MSSPIAAESPVVTATTLIPSHTNNNNHSTNSKTKRPAFRPQGTISNRIKKGKGVVPRNQSWNNAKKQTTIVTKSNGDKTPMSTTLTKKSANRGGGGDDDDDDDHDIASKSTMSTVGKQTTVTTTTTAIATRIRPTTKKSLTVGIPIGLSRTLEGSANQQNDTTKDSTNEFDHAEHRDTTTVTTTITNNEDHKSVLHGTTPTSNTRQDVGVNWEQLNAEAANGVRLSSFCSSFKVKRRRTGNKNASRKATTTTTVAATVDRTDRVPGRPTDSETEPTGAPVVQIIDGEIVLKEASLVVPGARRSVQEVEEDFQHVVEEDAQMAIVGASYNSFVNRRGPQHWTLDETKQFYEALRQLGTDFCAMEAFFENRTRKQLKRKYRTESTKNPKLVEMALDPKYQKEIGKRSLVFWIDLVPYFFVSICICWLEMANMCVFCRMSFSA